MPDIDAPDAVVAALWGAFALWAAWWGVPLLLTAAGATRYANGGEENPGRVEPDGTDPAYAAAFDALRTLGYEPLGPGWMRLTFYLRLWVFRTNVRAFRKRSAGRFAFLHEGPFIPGWHQLYFATCYADGGLDLTAEGFGESYSSGDGFASEVMATNDPAELEARHASRVAAREENGRRRDPNLELATLLDATKRHAQLSTISPTAQLARTEATVIGVPLALAVGVSAAIFGTWHWLPPAAGLIGLCVYAVLVWRNQARFAAIVRVRIAEREDEGW
jgi:hypothetical protein